MILTLAPLNIHTLSYQLCLIVNGSDWYADAAADQNDSDDSDDSDSDAEDEPAVCVEIKVEDAIAGEEMMTTFA